MLGQGTTVKLWLPVSPEPIDANRMSPSVPPRQAARERVLRSDDEDLFQMSTGMLMDLGYTGSAHEVLHVLHGGLAPDILVTDHLIPGINGIELARRCWLASRGLAGSDRICSAHVYGIEP